MKQKRTRTRARRLRRLRESRGLSQAELARRAGLSRSYLTNIESGTRDLMNAPYETIAALAKALGVTVARLMEDR